MAMAKVVKNDLTLIETVAANVRRLMRRRGMPAIRLAERMACSRQYIYLIKDGEGNITLETLEQLARALEVRPGELFRPVRVKRPRNPVPSHSVVGNGSGDAVIA